MTPAASFGARLDDNGVSFRLWAPAATNVDLVLEQSYPMHRQADGWYGITIPGAGAGTRYKYRIDGEIEVPDPASHFQPADVSGPSEVVDHAQYEWQASEWCGRPWHEAIFL